MSTITDLTTATTELLAAVNVSKATLDAQVAVVTALAVPLASTDGHTTGSLTAGQVTNGIIDNVGQANTACDLALPAAAAGLNFIMVAGEASTAAWRIRAAAADKFYLNGVAGADNGYVGIAAPAVGSYLSVFSFKTGANTWDWMAVVGNGNWVVS